jgi:Lon protease-like protein
VSVRLLPLFPLPLVLFPGAPLPLHIFEPRYQQLLTDVLAGDRLFGVICQDKETPEKDLAAGTVGCIAHVESATPIGDGRSNIVAVGRERFVFERFVVHPAPYHVGEVSGVTDDVESPLVLEPLVNRLRHLFERVGKSARRISDDSSPLPELPAEAGALSFAVAQYIDLDLPARQEILSSRSPATRLRQLIDLFEAVVDPIERRARTHERARTNGHGTAGHIE